MSGPNLPNKASDWYDDMVLNYLAQQDVMALLAEMESRPINWCALPDKWGTWPKLGRMFVGILPMGN